MNTMGVYLMLVLMFCASFMPATLSSSAFPRTEFEIKASRHRRLLALNDDEEPAHGVTRLSDWLPARTARRRREAEAAAAAAAAAGGTALRATPWAGKDPIADKLWPPGCHLWSVDPAKMQVRSDDGKSKKILRSLGSSANFPHGYVHVMQPFEGLQLGYGGLSIQEGYALDVWFKGAFSEPRMYVLAQGNRHGRPDKNGATWFPSWYLGIDGTTKDLMFHTSSSYHHLNEPTGLNVRSLSPQDWQRLTVVVLPHAPLVVAPPPPAVSLLSPDIEAVPVPAPRLMTEMKVFLNGTQQGVGITIPAMHSIDLLGNGGMIEDFMKLPWEGLYHAHVCALLPVKSQMGHEEAIHNNALQLLALTMKWENSWAAALRNRSVILVGNSAKIMTGIPNGAFIDSHDVVFRFNALQAATGSEMYLGRKTTFLVLGDLTQLCDCHDGACCTAEHALVLMRELAGNHGVTVMWARKDPPPPAFRAGVLRVSGASFVLIDPRKHFEEAFNEYLDSLAVSHPTITHRVPPFLPFRTGFRIIAALMFNEVKFTMIGFDLAEEKNALYNGKVTSGAEGQYVAETRILYDLATAGIFKSY